MIKESLGLSNWLLLISAVATVGYQLFFFFIAASFKFDKVTDLAGGSNFVLLVILCFCVGPLSAIPISISTRQWAVNILVIVWGVRLSGFLFYRILVTEADTRFDGIRDDLCKFGAFWAFQALWVFVVSLPVIYINGNDSNAPLTAEDYAGWTLAAIGLIIESVADAEKFSFRERNKKASVKAPFIRHGTWRWSRHPNYFGELLFWWSIFMCCCQTFSASGLQYYLLLSPVLISFLLLGGSGMPILELNTNKRLGKNSDFLQYRNETSPLIPLPNWIYRSLSPSFKAIFLFEWPIYGRGLDDDLLESLNNAPSRTSSVNSRQLSVTNPSRTASTAGHREFTGITTAV